MNMTIGLQELKNVVKVATFSNSQEEMSACIRNDERDISIKVIYFPYHIPENDIYPYWELRMVEEERFANRLVNAKNLKEVRDIYNAFITQGAGQSYIEDNILINR